MYGSAKNVGTKQPGTQTEAQMPKQGAQAQTVSQDSYNKILNNITGKPVEAKSQPAGGEVEMPVAEAQQTQAPVQQPVQQPMAQSYSELLQQVLGADARKVNFGATEETGKLTGEYIPTGDRRLRKAQTETGTETGTNKRQQFYSLVNGAVQKKNEKIQEEWQEYKKELDDYIEEADPADITDRDTRKYGRQYWEGEEKKTQEAIDSYKTTPEYKAAMADYYAWKKSPYGKIAEIYYEDGNSEDKLRRINAKMAEWPELFPDGYGGAVEYSSMLNIEMDLINNPDSMVYKAIYATQPETIPRELQNRMDQIHEKLNQYDEAETTWAEVDRLRDLVPEGVDTDMSEIYDNRRLPNFKKARIQDPQGAVYDEASLEEFLYYTGNPHEKGITRGSFMPEQDRMNIIKLYKAGMVDEAKAYYEEFIPYMNKQVDLYNQGKAQKLAQHPLLGWLAGLGTIPLNTLDAPGRIYGVIAGLAGDKEALDTHSSIWRGRNAMKAGMAERGNIWNEGMANAAGAVFGEGAKQTFKDKEIGRKVYNGAYSALNTAWSAAVGNVLGGAEAVDTAAALVMSVEGGLDTYEEQLEKGRKPGEAFLLGVAEGVWNYLTEKYITMEMILKPDVKGMLGNPKQLLGYIFKGTLSEESEEVAGYLLESATEWISAQIFNHKPEIEENAEKYTKELLKDNWDPAEAKEEGRRRAANDWWSGLKDTIEETAISTMLLLGSKTATSRVGMEKAGHNARKGSTNLNVDNDSYMRTWSGKENVDFLINVAKSLPEDTNAYQQATKLEGKKHKSNFAIGKLIYNINMEGGQKIQQATEETTKRIVKDQLIAQNVAAADATAYAELIYKGVTQGLDGLNKSEQQELMANEPAYQIFRGMMEPGATDISDAAKKTAKAVKTQNIIETGKDRQNISIVQQIAAGKGHQEIDIEKAAKDKFLQAKTAVAYAEPGDVQDVFDRAGVSKSAASVIAYTTDAEGKNEAKAGKVVGFEDGKVKVQFADGSEQTMDADSIETTNRNAQKIIGYMKTAPGIMSDDVAGKTLAALDVIGDQAAENFARDAVEINFQARLGRAMPTNYSIREDIAQDIYDTAHNEYEQAEKNRIEEGGELKPGQGGLRSGDVRYGTKEWSNQFKGLTEEQKDQLYIANRVATMFGFDIDVFQEAAIEDENGNKVQKQGYQKGAQIGLNIAGKMVDLGGKDFVRNILNGLDHEETHWIQKHSVEGYRQLVNFALNELEKSGGYNLEEEISKKIALYNKYYQDTNEIDPKTGKVRQATIDDAIYEIVADSCDQIMRSKEMEQRLKAEAPEAHKSIKEFVRRIVQRLSNAIRGMTRSGSWESQLIARMGGMEAIDEMARIWLGAYDEAIHNTVTKGVQTSNGQTIATEAEKVGKQTYTAQEINDTTDILNDAKKEAKGDFSLTAPVEMRKDGMIAVHNLDERSILSDMAMKGFPMPSIAVLSDKVAWEDYGDISIFFGEDAVDFADGTVYSGDAYTPVMGKYQAQSAEDALEYLRTQKARNPHMAYSTMDLFNNYLRIQNIDQAREKTNAYWNMDKTERIANKRRLKAIENDIMDKVAEFMDQEENTNRYTRQEDRFNFDVGYGMLLAAEELNKRENLSQNEKYEILQESMEKAAEENGSKVYDYGKNGTKIYDDMLEFIDGASRLASTFVESKPNRILGFGDVKAVVAPNSVADSTIQALKDAGVRDIITYDPNVENARVEALKSVPKNVAGTSFSITQQQNAEYMKAVENGDVKTQEEMVEQAAEAAMPDSKIRTKDGKLMKVFHGTKEQFNVFDTSKHGGLNGTAEGYGIYLTDNPEITKSYGDRQIAGYVNMKRPAYSNKLTITQKELAKLIGVTAEQEAQNKWEEEGYKSAKDAIPDTWISNYVYTPDFRNIKDAYNEVAKTILQFSDNDSDIIQEVMGGMAIRDYEKAMDFYHNILTPVTGFDGMWTQWKSSDGKQTSNILLAFDSSQIKSADPVTYDDNGNVIQLSERFNTKEQDIRYSLQAQQYEFDDRFKQNLTKLANKENLGTTDDLVIGETLQVLQDIGILNKTLVINQEHAKQALSGATEKEYKDKNHKASVNKIMKVIRSAADPIMIIESTQFPDSSVVIITEEEINNKTAIVPVRINTEGHDKVSIDVNRVTSAYGKDGIINMITHAFNQELFHTDGNRPGIYYINTKKAKQLQSKGLHVPNTMKNGLIHKVTDNPKFVKQGFKFKDTDQIGNRIKNKTDFSLTTQHPDNMDVMVWMESVPESSLATEAEKELLRQYKGMRTALGLDDIKISELTRKIRTLEEKGELNQEEKRMLDNLKIRLQNAKTTQAIHSEKMVRATEADGFARMMRDQQRLMNDLTSGKTLEEVQESVERMEETAGRTKAEIEAQAKELAQLAKDKGVQEIQSRIHKVSLDRMAKWLRKTYVSNINKQELMDSLAGIALKLADGQDIAQDVEDLAGRMIETMPKEGGENLEKLRGLTIELGKEQVKELRATNSSLKEIRSLLAGTGIKVVQTEKSGLDRIWNEICDMVPTLDRNASDKDQLNEILNLVQSEKTNAEKGLSKKYQEELVNLMEDIQSAALAVDVDIVTDPKAKKQIEKLQNIILELGGKTEAAAQKMAEMSARMDELIAKGKKAVGWTSAMRHDLQSTIDYFDKTAKMAVAQAKQNKQDAIIQQLKDENVQKMMKANDEWRALIQRDADARRQAEKNALSRKKMGTVVNRIYKLLSAETDQQNIPENYKGLARELLGLFVNNDMGEGSRRITEAGKMTLDRASELLKIWEKQDGPFNYADLTSESGQDENGIAMIVMDDLSTIEDALQEWNGKYKGKNKLDTLQQMGATLTRMQEAVSEIYNIIQSARTMDLNGRKFQVEEMALKFLDGIKNSRFKGEMTSKAGKAIDTVRKLAISGNVTPEYFFKNLKNEGMNEIWNEFKRAENRNGLEIAKAKEKLGEIAEKYGYNTWDQKKKYTVQTLNGTVDMTLEQLMALWATWKREKTIGPDMSEHLTKGGFYVADESKGKGLTGRKMDYARAHVMDEATMAMVGEMLTDEQKAYIDEMVGYMSNELSALGNEASMRMYGIKKYKESYYFPFKRWSGVANFSSDKGVTASQTENRAAHKGWTKRRTNLAKNALEIGNFTKMVADHAVEMINYNTMAPSIEAMNKMLNWQMAEPVGEEGKYTKRNMRTVFGQQYGKEALKYLETLMTDLNGGVAQDPRGSTLDKLLSTFKKNAVAGSLSVAAQQPLSYIRAAMEISPKYLAMGLNPATWKGSYREMMKHSGVAVIKEMGRFDMGYGASAKEYVAPESRKTTAQKVGGAISDFTTALPEMMDRVTWTRMWNAVKAEQKALHPDMDVKSDEFLDMCGERFNEVMRRTQVYDSTLVKSSNMRSKNFAMKSITSFMAEPTLSLNVLRDAAINIRDKGGIKKAAMAGATFMLSAIAQAAVKGFFGAGRNPDDKKTKEENLAYRMMYNLISEMNPMSLIPGYSSLIDTLKNGELTNNATTPIGKLGEIVQTVADTANSGGKIGYRFIEDTAAQMAQLFTGVPAKNIMRDARAMINFFAPDSGLNKLVEGKPYAKRENSAAVMKYQAIDTVMNQDLVGLVNKWMGDAGYKTGTVPYVKRIYEAKKAGDTKKVNEVTEYLLKGKGVKEDTIDEDLRKEIKADDSISYDVKMKMMKETGASKNILTNWIGDEYQKGKMDRETATRLYKEANPDAKDKDVYAALEKREYKAETGETGNMSDYIRIQKAIDADSKTDYDAAVKEMLDAGYEKKDIENSVLSYIRKEYKNGEISEDEAKAQLKKWRPDMSDDDIWWTIDRVNYQKETGKEVSGSSKYYRVTGAIDDNDKAAYDKAVKDMIKSGYKKEDIENNVLNHIRDQYKDGEISKEETKAQLKKWRPDMSENDIWWTLDRVDYQKETGADSVSGNYYRLYDAMDKNSADAIGDAVNLMVKHGMEKKNIKTQIGKKYKQAYLEADSNGKRKIRDAMQKAYRKLGYTAEDADKTIKGWSK